MSSTQKTCTKCGETKPLDEFSRARAARDGLRSQCKQCDREHNAVYTRDREKKAAYDAAYRAANREQILAREAAYRAANPEKIAARQTVYGAARNRAFRDYLDSLKIDGCVDCGAKLPPSELHFHHLDPATKVKEVGMMIGYSREKVDAEIAKCVLVCEPCHKKRHPAEDPIEKRRRARLNITPRPLRGRKLVA